MLGTRMPRRPVYPDRETPWYTRIVDMLKDRRTWTTLIYLFLMLPLGIFYFTFVVIGITVSVAMTVAPIVRCCCFTSGWCRSTATSTSNIPHPALLPLIVDLGNSAAHRHAAPGPGARQSAWTAREEPARLDAAPGLSSDGCCRLRCALLRRGRLRPCRRAPGRRAACSRTSRVALHSVGHGLSARPPARLDRGRPRLGRRRTAVPRRTAADAATACACCSRARAPSPRSRS